MIITYCDKCGALMHVKKLAGGEVCADCKAGHKPKRSRMPRHSDMIPRKKMDGKK
jgi:hypothetical protein